jgi:thioredoxin reductase
MEHVEAAIVGGGPAGLSAALVLGRSRRRVILFDDRAYRNQDSHALHGYLGFDGISPAVLRRRAREELSAYPDVELREVAVVDAARADGGFQLALADGGEVTCRALLLATGVVDELPSIDGAAALHGTRLFHCPYCDGWELRDQPLAAIGHPDDRGGEYALELCQWSRDLVLCTGGPARFSRDVAAALAARGVIVDERPLRALEADADGVTLRFAAGEPRWRRAAFYHLGVRQRSDLARRLGCRFDARGGVEVDRHEATCVRGLYVAGDATRDVLLAIVAASEGASAAVMINAMLTSQRQ